MYVFYLRKLYSSMKLLGIQVKIVKIILLSVQRTIYIPKKICNFLIKTGIGTMCCEQPTNKARCRLEFYCSFYKEMKA